MPEGRGRQGCATRLMCQGSELDNLESRLLSGDKWGDQEVLAKNVRKDSPVACLLGLSTKLAVFINAAGSLGVLTYDDEEEEWYGQEIPPQQVHQVGKLAGEFLPGSSDNFYVFFQDASKRLVRLDNEWTPAILPAEPLAGTPLHATVIDGKMHVFYVSDKDHYLHYLSEEEEEDWVDNIMAKCVLDETLISLVASRSGDGEGVLEAYIYTVGRTILQVRGRGEGETREIGKVNREGAFVPGVEIEHARFLWAPIVMKLLKKYTSKSTDA
ncbi:hypothetical protein NM688_g258 [Phlebia brevispora]|uniref:Uncharacterized protein n=1 Tax=Phlebia brevispora TaxID=194682 RepID=A0ACC1TEK5_9APHY|nr:hypothetical protein NM688_g258 [Phlebia brevispora]